MAGLPPLIPFGVGLGEDDAERWHDFVEGLYGLYKKTLVRAGLTFRGLPVRCRFMFETFGKHYAFWHMMQEGPIEDDRTIDPERCERLLWLGWTIENANSNACIRVFKHRPEVKKRPACFGCTRATMLSSFGSATDIIC